jgi:hypothetical protein
MIDASVHSKLSKTSELSFPRDQTPSRLDTAQQPNPTPSIFASSNCSSRHKHHQSHRFHKPIRSSSWYVYSSCSIRRREEDRKLTLVYLAYTNRNSNPISPPIQSPNTPHSPSSRWPLKSHRCPTAATRPSTVSTNNKPTTHTPRKTTTRHPLPPPTPPPPLLLSPRSPRMRSDGTSSSNTTPL